MDKTCWPGFLTLARCAAQAGLALAILLASCATPLASTPIQPQPTPIAQAPIEQGQARPGPVRFGQDVVRLEREPAGPAPDESPPAGQRELVAQRTADSATFDMGDGRYALVQDARPMHYKDEQGNWQRINPAFVAAERGWANLTNAVKARLAPRRSAANIVATGAGVGWEPHSLVVEAAGERTTLATPLAESQALTGTLAADGRSVRYAGSWSDPTLQDEWRSGLGNVEYALRLSALPNLASDLTDFQNLSGLNLELRVNLHLLPGTSVQVEGKPVKPAGLPLETPQALAFVGPGGDMLWLEPPQAYEQADPSARAAGSYVLAAGADPTTPELRVRVPWRWLAAAGRQFPVVIDPVFQMRTGTIIKRAIYNNNGTFSHNDYVTRPELGQFLNGVSRILVQFGLPTMPPNTTISHAYVTLAPTDINFTNRNYLTVGVEAYELTDDGWIGSASSQPQPKATPIPPFGDNVVAYSRGNNETLDMVTWDITSLAQGWLPTLLDPGSNDGLMLRTVGEFCTPNPDGCGGFYVENQYTPDDLQEIEAYYTGAQPDYANPARGGLRLVVIYSGPTLYEGQVVSGLLDGLPNPPGNDPYYHTDHEYRLQGLPADHWQAIVARGLGGTFGPNPPTQVDYPYGRNLAGTVLLELRDTQDAALDLDPPQNQQLSYILLNGPRAPGQQYRLRVKPNVGDSPPNGYDIRLIAQKSNIVVPLDNSVLLNYQEFDSRDPLALWNVTLPAGSHARVDIDVYGHNHSYGVAGPVGATYDYARGFSAQLYNSDQPYLGATKTFRPVDSNVGPTDTGIPYGSVRLASGIFTAGSAPYALALAYNGPLLNLIYTYEKSGEFWMPKTEPLKYYYRVRITACSGDTFPTRSGVCQQVKCPTTGFPSAGRVNVGGMQLWSENGWSGGVNVDGPAPMIGDLGDVAPTVAVVGGQVSYGGGSFTLDSDSEAMLVNCGSLAYPTNPLGNNFFSVYSGAMANAEMYEDVWIEPSAKGSNHFNPWRTEDETAIQSINPRPAIFPTLGRVQDTATFQRKTGADLSFTVEYSTNYQGWPALQSSVNQNGATDPPPVAGTLILDLGSAFSMDTSPANGKDQARTFEAVRAGAATITQPANLGGASKPVQAVILGKGQVIPSDPPQVCNAAGNNCVDLRALDDAANVKPPRRTWQMPDVHISGQAGMVVMSTPGNLQVYSVDHPAAARSPQDVSRQFSFDTFDASVSIQQEACEPNGPVVTVVRGETRMTMPNIGDGSDPNGVIAATFKLCQTSLRSVSFQFHSPVGIPLGSSGLFVTGMTGQVELFPDYTQIQFTLDFQAAQGGDGGIFKGSGSVIINTLGYFEFAGVGKILGIVNADGKLWVAWSPLDIGFEVNVGYSDWLTGFARMHMWEGQGWQHKYSWLPNNDEKHLAAQIGATIHIEQGAAFSWWFIDIPPCDMSFGIEVAFGQFCTNSACTSYEWGVKGKFSVAGYGVGMYYGFDEGFDFILGNDGHKLIDQYGVAAQSVEQGVGDERMTVHAAAVAIGGVSTETFSVSADAEHLLFAMGWQTGTPQVKILAPNGADISTSSAYTVAISETAHSRLIGVQLAQPSPGVWKAVLSNLSGQEHYKFVYLASKGAPGTPADPGHFIQPGAGVEDGSGVYTITWQVPAGTPPSATIGLYYTPYWKDPMFGYFYTDTVAEIPIVKNLPFSAGHYRWDTSGLRNKCLYHNSYLCYYGLRAIVDDGVNTFPPGGVRQPDDTCLPGSELPDERAYAANRFPGLSTFSSVGKIVVTDTVAPGAPTGLALKGIDGAILARWNPSPEKDLSGYLVRWGLMKWAMIGGWGWLTGYNETRVTATPSPTLRLGGLRNDVTFPYAYGVSVRAVDTNDNVGPAIIARTYPTSDTMAQVPLAPINFTLQDRTSTGASFSWQPAAGGPAPASYRLAYRRLGVIPTLSYSDTTSTSITIGGLPTGRTYEFSVSAANSEGWRSASTEAFLVRITNLSDEDGDGLADDWAAAYGVWGGSSDADGDGLTNKQEYSWGLDPTRQDSDGDGFSDAEEKGAGTDMLDSTRFPAQFSQPRLELGRDRLVFYAKAGSPAPAAQTVDYSNSGKGNLSLGASSTSAWIKPLVGLGGSVVQVSVDPIGLRPGYHSGVVRLNGLSGGDPLIGGPYCIRVDLWLSYADAQVPSGTLYLPLVVRK